MENFDSITPSAALATIAAAIDEAKTTIRRGGTQITPVPLLDEIFGQTDADRLEAAMEKLVILGGMREHHIARQRTEIKPARF